MYSLSEITLFVIISNTKLSVSKDKETLKPAGECNNPVYEKNYSPEVPFKFCVYGIKYNAETGTTSMDDKLIFNDPNTWDETDYDVTNFQEAATPLCNAVGKIQEDRAIRNVTLFYGAWVKKRDGSYVDIYMACCKPCLRLDKYRWLRWLKSQYTLRHEYAIKETSTVVFHNRTMSLFNREFLYQEKSLQENTQENIGSCIDKQFRVTPVSQNNYVCFVAGHDRLNYQSIYGRAVAPNRGSKEELLEFGIFSAQRMKHFLYSKCENTIQKEEYNECFIYIHYDWTYGYECCCYGLRGARCQEQFVYGIDVGINNDFVFGAVQVCAVDEAGPSFTVSFTEKGVTYKGNGSAILEYTRKFEFCEMHLISSGKITFTRAGAMKKMNATYQAIQKTLLEHAKVKRTKRGVKQALKTTTWMRPTTKTVTAEATISEKEMQHSTMANNANGNHSDHTGEEYRGDDSGNYNGENDNYDYDGGVDDAAAIEDTIISRIETIKIFHCRKASTWDRRELSVLRFRCVELLPLDAQCPLHPAEPTKDYHIMCCCNERSFCNYDPAILVKSKNMVPKRCKYSNEFQYYFHEHLYPAHPDDPHTCLMHFASPVTLKYLFQKRNEDIMGNLKRLYLLPGSAISPVDFSYALIKPGDCRLVDVHLNTQYLDTRHCSKHGFQEPLSDTLHSTHFPARLVVCRCNTTDLSKPCDDLHELSTDAVSIGEHLCGIYSEERIIITNYEIGVNDGSSFCMTYVALEILGERGGMGYRFQGSPALQKHLIDQKLAVDILAYVAYKLSNEGTVNCDLFEDGAACFCYDSNVPSGEQACNGAAERMGALANALKERVRYRTREFTDNPLASFGAIRSPVLCPTPSVFASLTVDGGKAFSWSSCVVTNQNFHAVYSERAYCAEKIVFEECVMHTFQDGSHEDRLLCCCTDCDNVGSLVTRLRHELQEYIELKGIK